MTQTEWIHGHLGTIKQPQHQELVLKEFLVGPREVQPHHSGGYSIPFFCEAQEVWVHGMAGDYGRFDHGVLLKELEKPGV